jgi:hypothetical protein
MAVDEAARHQLYSSLESTLGPDATSTLMSLLPPVGWADVATRQDLTSLGNELRAEIAGIRSEMSELRADMHEQIGGLRTDMHEQIGGLRTELHTSLRGTLFSMIGAMFTLAALTWGAVTFGG